MIRESEVSEIISKEIPALAFDLCLTDRNKLYKAVSILSQHTKDLIRAHRSSEVIQCFQTAYGLMNEGTALIKLAVVNIYISSVSRLLEYSFCPDQSVRKEFLSKFGNEYSKLIYSNNP